MASFTKHEKRMNPVSDHPQLSSALEHADYAAFTSYSCPLTFSLYLFFLLFLLFLLPLLSSLFTHLGHFPCL